MEGSRNYSLRRVLSWCLAVVRVLWARHTRLCALLLAGITVIGTSYCLRSLFPGDDEQDAAGYLWESLKHGYVDGNTPSTNAVPFLIDYLKQKPSALGRTLDRFSGKSERIDRVLEHLPSAAQTDECRATAAEYLGRLGAAAGAGVPLLGSVLADAQESQRLRYSCFYSLTDLKEQLPPYTEHFCKLLGSSDVLTQQFAAELLGLIGPKAKVAVPILLVQAANTNSECAAAAGYALWRIDRKTNVAVRALTNALNFEPAMQLGQTLRRLAEMGPAASEAAEAVVPFLGYGKYEVRNGAEKTLAAIDPAILKKSLAALNAKAPEHVERLLKKLENNDVSINYTDLLLAFSGHYAPDVISRLVKLIQSTKDNPRMRRVKIVTARFLGEIGPLAKMAEPALEQMIEETEGIEDAVAAEALVKICPTNSNAISVLTNVSWNALAQSKAEAGRYGMRPSGAEMNLKNPEHLREEYITLWKLRLVKDSPMEDLLKCIQKQDSYGYSYTAAQELGELGAEARPALPILEKWIGPTNDWQFRSVAALAIRRIDPAEFERLNLPGVLGVP